MQTHREREQEPVSAQQRRCFEQHAAQPEITELIVGYLVGRE